MVSFLLARVTMFEGGVRALLEHRPHTALGLLVFVAACGFPRPPDVAEDAPNIDSSSSSPEIVTSNTVSRADAPDGVQSFMVPSSGVYVIDTDQGSIYDANNANQPIRVAGGGVHDGVFYRSDDKNRAFFGVQSLTLAESAILRAVGSRALILVADGPVEIHGIIDVSAGHCSSTSDNLSCGGPGGGHVTSTVDTAGCSPGKAGMFVTGGYGGGGGGGFGSPGGAGGTANATVVVAGGMGGSGVDCAGSTLDPIQGGSAGGGTAAGGGGGAVQVTSYTSITIVRPATPNTSGVWAGGAGGGPGVAGGSGPFPGGGGGAGGAILLEATSISIASGTVLAANGGGGGGGAGAHPTAGQPGRFGNVPASGGTASTSNGGAGAALNAAAVDGMVATSNSESSPAGGGGGGGVGRIRINAVTLTNLSTEAIVSPQASVNAPAAAK